MASPPAADQRSMSLVMSLELAQHIDKQATRYGISRAGFLRMLVARDAEQQRQLQQHT